jgi:transcriptional regulator with XRE-family HTH domain
MMKRRPLPHPKPTYGNHYLRQWREYREYTLEKVGEIVGISHAQLGRIERRLQPYNQGLLEKLADLYRTTPASLVMRDPTDPDAMWSIWDQAKEGEREKIAEYADFIVKSRTGT